MSIAENKIFQTSLDNNSSQNSISAKKENFSGTWDTLAYDDEMIERVISGIVQNLSIELDKRGISLSVLARMSNVHYSHLYGIFRNEKKIGLAVLIKITLALHINPAELFPYAMKDRKTNGERFDEITKGMDISSCNFLLEQCIAYANEWHRLKHNNRK